ncbi:uncharacterized protein LOC135378049 [Ornithodoros turicata]|uniref:uncharacterized protein LOC135378049 n=1 Tax=Ornithodoros turicata TaxID=34597 RepID=UPI003138DC54
MMLYMSAKVLENQLEHRLEAVKYTLTCYPWNLVHIAKLKKEMADSFSCFLKEVFKCSVMEGDTIVCLASYGVSTKKILVHGDRKLTDVLESLRESSFAGLVTEFLLVQVLDQDLNKYVDMDEDTVLQHRSELKLVVLPQGVGTTDTEKAKETAASDVMPTPAKYSGKMCRPAAQQLVRRHPQLRDLSLDGCGSWHMSLRNKGKNVRKAMSGVPEVDATRSKSSKKSNDCTSLPTSTSATSVCVPRNPPAPGIYGSGEDETTINGHLSLMVKEMKKHDYSEEKIKFAMNCTFTARRNWIDSGNVLVADVIEKYPALKTDAEIRNEFKKLTGVDADAAVLQVIQTCGHKVLDIASKKRTLKDEVKRMQEHIKKLKGDEQKYCFAVAVLQCLPGLVKELWNRWLM